LNFVHIPKTGGTSIGTALNIGHDHLPASKVSEPRFTFVRNPFDRLVSVWEFCRPNPVEKLRQIVNGMTFAEFARVPCDNLFLRTQSSWLDAPVEFIGRFESLHEDFAKLSDKPLPHLLKSERRPWREYYDADTLAYVAERYAEDFVRFGYVPAI
jgi:hypothetical protein